MRLSVTLAVVASLGLASCASLGFSPINAQATPDVQKTQADAQAAFEKALSDRLEHCAITGSLAVGIGGLAATGTGFSNTAQINCPGKPWDAAPVPISQLGLGQTAPPT